MTQLLALAMLFALLRYLRIRNRNRGSDLPPTYTVTPWDEFRSRVCEATGRSTVAGNPEVTQYPGGWIVWEDLAHQVTDAAMPLEEALERGPCTTELSNAAPNSSPWIGRRVWANGRDCGTVGYHVGDSLFCALGTPDAADAELHWDDVRAGDVQTADAFHLDAVTRDVVGRDGHQLHVVGLAREFVIVPTAGDRFLPAGVA